VGLVSPDSGPLAPIARRAAPHANTFRRRSLLALLFAVVVVAGSWTALISYKHSLSLSSIDVTGAKPGTSFDVFRCGASTRYRSGRVDKVSGVGHVTLPFGCWEARPEKNDETGFTAQRLIAPSTGRDTVALFVLGAMGALTVGILYPAVRAVIKSRRAVAAMRSGDVYQARIDGDDARQWSSNTFGSGTAILVVSGLIGFLSLANGGVRTPFFRFSLMTATFGELLRAFTRNVFIFMIAEAIVLVWGMIIAVARLAPGKAGRPVRALAIFYIDLFRGVPAVIVLFLLDFGFRKSKIPTLSTLDDRWYAIIALSLTYGAYVAEVYRSGIESIHWSQTAAARSLGLSYSATMRHVVVPQAVRRIIPPLLNDFIGLQKDTALASFVSVSEAFLIARNINSNNFNLSAITVVAVFFYAITVPQARVVDRQIRRDQARTRAGG
jgi:polar amino acid transport system permease protein